jgi:threonine/homoserine/homoserine lactone efflux protein
MHFLPPARELMLFVTAAAILLVIPGPAVLYIITRSAAQGRTAGLASALGIVTGTLLHVSAAALGLSALMMSSATAYAAVKYAGAAYLFYLGIRKLRERQPSGGPGEVKPTSLRRIYAQGVVVNALNPKAALFFFAFLPQFVSASRGHVTMQFVALGMIFALMGLVTDSLWALTAGTAGGWLRGRGIARRERYIVGTVYMGLGLATAISGSRHR